MHKSECAFTDSIFSQAFKITTDEEFDNVFGFEKPLKNSNVVLYCGHGIKAREIADLLAVDFGYTNVKVYLGSWADWCHNRQQPA